MIKVVVMMEVEVEVVVEMEVTKETEVVVMMTEMVVGDGGTVTSF